MYAYDFEYDGKRLSDFGFIIASLGEQSGVSTTDAGSEITFITSPMQAGKRFVPGGSKYDKCLETSFQICKNPMLFDDGEMEITADEFRALSRWLNRREFLWFHASDWCNPEKARAWVRASFSLSRVDASGVTYGIELKMQTDSPFCYGEEVVEELTFASGALTKTIEDKNDEIGITFPRMVITCGASGKLTLSNSMTGCSCSVSNCTSGEVLTFSGDTKIISTSNVAHDVVEDFNYNFFSIGNTFSNKVNSITSNKACTVELRYRPIYKDTL